MSLVLSPDHAQECVFSSFADIRAVLVAVYRSQKEEAVLRACASNVKEPLALVPNFVLCFAFDPGVLRIFDALLWLNGDFNTVTAVPVGNFVPDNQIIVVTGGPLAELRNDDGIEFKTFRFVNGHDSYSAFLRARRSVQVLQAFAQQAEIADRAAMLKTLQQRKESLRILVLIGFEQGGRSAQGKPRALD